MNPKESAHKSAPDSTPADTHAQLQHLQVEIDKARSLIAQAHSQLDTASETAARLSSSADPHTK